MQHSASSDEEMQLAKTAKIAELNDQLRQKISDPSPNRVNMTQGITTLFEGPVSCIFEALRQMLYINALMSKIKKFDDFDEDNNPHGERDFGIFTYHGHQIYWKIDYYDTDFQYLSEDPANPEITRRVLTIMLSSEY